MSAERRWTPELVVPPPEPLDPAQLAEVEAAIVADAAARPGVTHVEVFATQDEAEAALRAREAEVVEAQAAVDAAQHELDLARNRVVEVTARIAGAGDDEIAALSAERAEAVALVEARSARVPTRQLALQQAQGLASAAALGVSAVIVRVETQHGIEHDAAVKAMLVGVSRAIDLKLVEQQASSTRLQQALQSLARVNVAQVHRAHTPARLATITDVVSAFHAELGSYEAGRAAAQSKELQERLQRGAARAASENAVRDQRIAAASATPEMVRSVTMSTTPVPPDSGIDTMLNDL